MASTLIATALLAIPVVDIDNTIFVQGGIYLALIVILKPMLFDPWLRAQQRRHDAIEGALEKAQKLRRDADALGQEYDDKLGDARDKALDTRSKIRRDEESTQAEMLASIRNDATKKLDTDRERIAAEAASAREALTGRVDELAEHITSKVLGRAS